MSLVKGLLIQPRPCPFCGGCELELRAIVFRQWNMHCLDTDCRCKGPDGKTPDLAVAKWNTINQNSIDKRKDISQMQKDYENPSTTDKIWKAARALRTFTVTEAARITECNRDTVAKYLYLLEKNNYLRIEGQKNSPGSPNVYRVIRTRVVQAPGWIRLQLTDEEYARYRNDKNSLSWKKVRATG